MKKTKLINEYSILNMLPPIERKQLLVLDAVRFTGEIIDVCYDYLDESLFVISTQHGKARIPEAFHHAWSIIDHAQRMLKILLQIPSESNHRDIKFLIEKIKKFRHTYQHIDERIDESLIKNEHPVYGKLRWSLSYDQNRIVNYIAVSGVFFSKIHEWRNGTFHESLRPSEIKLETVDKKEKIEFNLSDLKNNLIELIKKLEDHLYIVFENKGIDLVDRTSTTDILICFKSDDLTNPNTA